MTLPYQKILENMSNGALCVNARGDVLLCNQAAARMLDRDADALSGTPLHQLFLLEESPENLDFFQTLLDAVAEAGRAHQRKVALLRPDGTSLHLLVRSERVPWDDSFLVLVTLQDVTELETLRQAEISRRHEVEEAYRTLETARSAARWKWGLVALLLAPVAFALGLLLRYDAADTPPRRQEKQTAGTQTALLRSQSLSIPILLNGRFEPLNTVSIAAPFAGRIVGPHVHYGQHVKKNDELITLDPADLELGRRQEEARLIKARQAHEELLDWSNSLETARSSRSLARASNQMERARRRLEEAEALFAKGIIPASERNDLLNQFENSRLEWETAQDEAQAVKSRGGSNHVQVARLELEAAREALRRVNEKIESSVIRAPVAGIVIRPPETGEKRQSPLEAGGRVNEHDILLAIGDTSGLSMRVRVDEIDWLKITPGAEAQITGDAFPGVTLTGRVVSVSAQAKTEHGSKPMFEALIAVERLPPGHAGVVRLGMSGRAAIVTYASPEALLAPIAAVRTDGDRASVRVRDAESGTLRDVEVEVGPTTIDEVEIRAALRPGDEVLLP